MGMTLNVNAQRQRQRSWSVKWLTFNVNAVEESSDWHSTSTRIVDPGARLWRIFEIWRISTEDLKEILRIFFDFHDPTTLNRQGHDVGTQYRSAIFFHNPEQKAVAEDIINTLDKVGIWTGNIVTEVNPLDTFFIAEDYHQEYYEKNMFQPYCQIVISPKIMKLNEYYKDRLITSF